jgi:2,5-diamino-6-(ribosylamino)-4(3H)-pyrimidinone 5'-phosphate reductase
VPELVAGHDRVELPRLLHALAEQGHAVVRVDSGGALTGALLAERLVDEVSLLVHPAIAASTGPHWHGGGTPGPIDLELDDCRRLAGGLAWLRYRIAGGEAGDERAEGPHPERDAGPPTGVACVS